MWPGWYCRKLCVTEALNKAKRHDEIRVLALSKLNSISDLISKAAQDERISAEEYALILNEWEKYGQMKEAIRHKTQQTHATQSTVSKNKLMAAAREQIIKELAASK